MTVYKRCRYCRKEKDPSKIAKPYRADYQRDPYCSRKCLEADLAEKATA